MIHAPLSFPLPESGASYFHQIEPANIRQTEMASGKFQSKREAEDAVRAAFKEKAKLADANVDFAQICHIVHSEEWLTDGEIARVIGGKPSRTGIQQLRKKVERESGQ